MMNLNNFNFTLFLGLSLLLFSSCVEERVFEENIDLKNRFIARSDTIQFEFEITEPEKSYALHHNIRYNTEFPFYNFYLRFILKDSLGKEIKSKENQMILFNKKDGTPLGEGQGNLYFRRAKFLKDYKFPYKGKYSIEYQQYLRNDSIKGVYTLGLFIQEEELKTNL